MLSGSEPEPPGFLSLPSRPSKPRSAGLTHVLDKGLPLVVLRNLVEAVGDYIDVWKFGYGLSYFDSQLARKLSLLAANGVRACPGGTLAEICWLQQKTDQYFDWLQTVGMDCVEISNGASAMPAETKRQLIATAAGRGFEVFAEVGSKDPNIVATPSAWAEEAQADLDAGATWIVAEGRDSGTVGLYDADGQVRSDLVAALETVGAQASVIYEAPLRAQQAWLIRHVGPNVNLGNIAGEEVLSLEALRLGLRADTIVLTQARVGGQCSV